MEKYCPICKKRTQMTTIRFLCEDASSQERGFDLNRKPKRPEYHPREFFSCGSCHVLLNLH